MDNSALRTLWEVRHSELYPEKNSFQNSLAGSGFYSDDFQGLFTSLLGKLAASDQQLPHNSSTRDASTLFSPLAVNLLDQLLALYFTEGNDWSQAIPEGMPANGPVSQGSHPGHVAIDLAIPVETPVTSTMSGKVVYAGWNDQGYGNLVIVENGPYRTYYAHLSSIPVKLGQTVPQGMVIGLSGNTGNSTGPHLHYEVRLNGKRIDPTPFMA